MTPPSDRFTALPWRPAGAGCEGEVDVAPHPEFGWVRRKQFRFRSDLARYAVNAVLIDQTLTRLAYRDLVGIPPLLAVEPALGIAYSGFVRARDPPVDHRRSLGSAINAMTAVAGYLGALGDRDVRAVLTGASREDLVQLLPRPLFSGLDLNDANWVYDGELWTLVDF